MSASETSAGENLALCTRSSLCDVLAKTSMLQLIKERKRDAFFAALEDASPEQVNFFNGYPDYCTCLDYTCENGLVEYAQALLEIGRADPTLYNAVRKGTALHSAVQAGHPEIVRLLLRHGANVTTKNDRGRTPLHLTATWSKTSDGPTVARYLLCMEALLEDPNVEVNCEDRRGCTVLQQAVSRGWFEGVQKLLENGANPEIVGDDDQTTLEMMQEKMPELVSLWENKLRDDHSDETQVVMEDPSSRLFTAMYRGDTEEFHKLVLLAANNNFNFDASDGRYTYLQYAADNGHDEFVQELLKHGANPNAVCDGNTWPPLLLAAYRGYHRVLRILYLYDGDVATDLKVVDSDDRKQTLLHKLALREAKAITNSDRQDYDRCLVDLFADLKTDPMRININAQDILENTPLHYAASSGSEVAILTLLHNGARVGIKNMQDNPAILQIPPSILETFLDECIEASGNPNSDKYKLTFRYEFLSPHYITVAPDLLPLTDMDPMKGSLNDVNLNGGAADDLLPETEPLWYLCQSRKHKYLLKHPVISSFLYLKWQCIRTFFYGNLLVYLLYVALVTYYLLARFGRWEDGVMEEVAPSVLYAITVCWVWLVVREAFQLAVSIKRYFFSVENWIETTVFVFTGLILYSDVSDDVKRHLSAFVILLAWTELVFLVGRHPRLSTYVTMFMTVTLNYLLFFVAFSLLIIAFALSFYLLFHTCLDGADDDGCDDESFHTIPLSVLRTLVMMIGEFEFVSLPFDPVYGTSHLVFFLFLFVVVIVLLNLLNGLAVSDTQAIKDQAELVSFVSRVQLVSYVESMLLGDPFNFFSNWAPFRWMKRCPDCAFCQLFHSWPRFHKFIQQVTFSRRTLLLPSLPKGELTVVLASRMKVTPGKFRLDETIVESARSRLETFKVRNDVDTMKAKLESMEAMMARMMQKIDKLAL